MSIKDWFKFGGPAHAAPIDHHFPDQEPRRVDPDEPRPDFAAPTKHYFPDDAPEPEPDEKKDSGDKS